MSLPDKDSTSNHYELPKKVALLYSEVKREYFATESSYKAEVGADKYAALIASYINKLGVNTELIECGHKFIEGIKKIKPDMIINLVDTFEGSDFKASFIPGILDVLGIPYVGSDSMGFTLSSNKYLVSKLLQANGVPVAHSQLFATPNDYIDPTMRFPLISKLNETHGSIEVSKDSISENEKHLRERLKFLQSQYKEPVLVEEFIVGREVTAALLEGLNKKVYIGERIFENQQDEKYQLLTFEMKWDSTTEQEGIGYQKYEDPILREYVKKAFSVLGMYDYARFDIRIDSSGRYFFLDANPNPFLGPKETGGSLSSILDLYGVEYEEIMQRLLINTVRDMQGEERLPYSSNED